MMLGPIIVLLWVGLVMASVAAPVACAVRHGTRGLGRSLWCPVGTLMAGSLLVLAIGLLEGSLWAGAAWALVTVGIAGVALAAYGVGPALRPRRRPGDCPGCGYAMGDLARCPECGRAR